MTTPLESIINDLQLLASHLIYKPNSQDSLLLFSGKLDELNLYLTQHATDKLPILQETLHMLNAVFTSQDWVALNDITLFQLRKLL